MQTCESIWNNKAFIESAQQSLDLCQSKSEYIIVTKQQADWLYDELEDVDGITYQEDDEKDVRKILSYLTRKDKSASEWNKKDKNRWHIIFAWKDALGLDVFG
jgi:hypothetical protein